MLRYERRPPVWGDATHHCLVLHGLGDSGRGWMPVADELAIPGLGWIFADAPDSYSGGYSWFPIPGMTAPEHDQRAFIAGVQRSRDLLRTLIDHLSGELQICPERLFLMGFSQGCFLVLDQALRSAHLFAGVAAISGALAFGDEYPDALGPAARDQRIFWSHGRADELLPIDATAAAAHALQDLGLAIDWREYPKAHSLQMPEEIDDLRTWFRSGMGA